MIRCDAHTPQTYNNLIHDTIFINEKLPQTLSCAPADKGFPPRLGFIPNYRVPQKMQSMYYFLNCDKQ